MDFFGLHCFVKVLLRFLGQAMIRSDFTSSGNPYKRLIQREEMIEWLEGQTDKKTSAAKRDKRSFEVTYV